MVNEKFINLEGVFKKFSNNKSIGIKEFFIGKKEKKSFNQYYREWALNDITLSVKEGESLLIVGHNGSGKSTLLSIIANVIQPDKGKVLTSGKIISMLELTNGLNTELSGIENIFLYSSFLEVPLKKIKENLNKIINFSDLGDAIHNPVKSYSSGMTARLVFSTIIFSNPDILLIDEVYAVGDQFFKEKCKNYLKEFIRNNGILVIVSHELKAAEELCKYSIQLNQGMIVASGLAKDVVIEYEKA
jgi:ABC-type polysaccharide/polyol phosphate transport system ATPase subunit